MNSLDQLRLGLSRHWGVETHTPDKSVTLHCSRNDLRWTLTQHDIGIPFDPSKIDFIPPVF